jgi:hypothetical protein
MADTKDRMQRLRARRLAQGERPVELWLDPDSKQRLFRLRQSGETINQVIRRALMTLEAQANTYALLSPRSALSDKLSDTPERTLLPLTPDTMSRVPRKAPEVKAPVFSDQRRDILTLLHQHPAGLSPVQTRQLLGSEKDLGNTMKSMARDGFLRRLKPGLYAIANGGD